ncbi:RNA polymerase sigma factor [Virgibacillus sp. JSM 102003]|uniref:RNA polymerase sigma factor n=1 Tax=Virgibacillus sp. JSM 102003 TaxID=1562108 RepID=UPI0035BEF002
MPADQELIDSIINGNENAMEILTRKYYPNIFSFVYRKMGDKEVAYDLTQEIFIKMIKKIHTYSSKSTFKGWLYTIAANTCKDYWRSLNFKNLSKQSALPGNLKSKFNISHILERNEKREEINTAINNLPDYQKEAIILKYFHDLKIKEIAKITGSTIPTVKSRLKQGLGKLAKVLDGGVNHE